MQRAAPPPGEAKRQPRIVETCMLEDEEEILDEKKV